MNIFTKLIMQEHPDYDPNHTRYNYGDLIQIDDRGIAVALDNFPMEEYCYVVKSTFGFKAGEYCRVPYTRITGIIERTINDKIVWKSGDLIKDGNDMFVLLEYKDGCGWHAVCSKANTSGVYEGSCYYITSPYADYLERR